MEQLYTNIVHLHQGQSHPALCIISGVTGVMHNIGIQGMEVVIV